MVLFRISSARASETHAAGGSAGSAFSQQEKTDMMKTKLNLFTLTAPSDPVAWEAAALAALRGNTVFRAALFDRANLHPVEDGLHRALAERLAALFKLPEVIERLKLPQEMMKRVRLPDDPFEDREPTAIDALASTLMAETDQPQLELYRRFALGALEEREGWHVMCPAAGLDWVDAGEVAVKLQPSLGDDWEEVLAAAEKTRLPGPRRHVLLVGDPGRSISYAETFVRVHTMCAVGEGIIRLNKRFGLRDFLDRLEFEKPAAA
jgi:hypothetical protein